MNKDEKNHKPEIFNKQLMVIEIPTAGENKSGRRFLFLTFYFELICKTQQSSDKYSTLLNRKKIMKQNLFFQSFCLNLRNHYEINYFCTLNLTYRGCRWL